MGIPAAAALGMTAAGRKATPGAAAAGRPNVLVIMTDDQDAASLPVMRNLMSFPRGSWVHFTNAFANDAICSPSRATLLTGQYSHRHGVISNAAKHTGKLDEADTLAVWLHDAGYRTGVVGKYMNGIKSRQPGWDTWQVGTGTVDKQTGQAVAFLGGGGPFFLWLSYTAPHKKAKPPDRYKNVAAYVPPDSPNYLEGDVSDKPQWVRQLPIPGTRTLNEWRAERLNGQRELLAVDDGIQTVVDALAAAGQLENTLILFLSDQGFSFGSHRWFYKHAAYDECARFPLLVRYPGAENREEPRFVSNVSLAATICEWTGVEPGRPVDGASLIPLLSGAAVTWDETLLIEKRAGSPNNSNFWGVRSPGWMYAEYENGDVELYDMAADPWQMRSVHDQAGYAAALAEMREALAELRGTAS